MKVIGQVWEAQGVCGPFWMAAFVTGVAPHLPIGSGTRNVYKSVEECSTRAQAIEWLTTEARRRDYDLRIEERINGRYVPFTGGGVLQKEPSCD